MRKKELINAHWMYFMRVSVVLNDFEGEVFSEYCRVKGYKKSTLIKRLIREHIDSSDYNHQVEMFSKSRKS